MQAGTLDDEGGMGIGDVKVGTELWVQNRVPWLAARAGAAQCQTFV